ncbi:ribonuclease BN [Halobaculum sp. CBA1158]|uniref:DUF7139 domain-containing protein n=1 Tax=Halobaculum sp. CBA1158 TaxID=2904243 RepID=UPI001F3F69CF|nr:ribonuclease BN [Halobaculum sp. CBA1158]UIP00237.1 ribonuclease BN [Halobaculum sp. CBA1158]
MSSLAEVYEGRVGEYASLRRLYLGVGAFSLGALLVVAGIVIAATDVTAVALGWNLAQAREAAGVLAGLGLPATFLGVLAIMPASRRTQAAAVVGAGVAVLGVALFTHAYPCRWSGARCAGEFADLTLPTAGVYFLGAFTTFWCLFTGVANFKARNNPGGTVSLEITREGETKVIEVPKAAAEEIRGAKASSGSVGGVGLLGVTPDGDVETQTNRPEARRDPGDRGDRSAGGSSGGLGSGGSSSGPGTVSDGGAAANDITSLREGSPGSDGEASARSSPSRPQSPSEPQSSSGSQSPQSPQSPDDSAAGSPTERSRSTGDTYCGSCGHFQYVRTENGMQPYCGLHDDLMDDMDACDDWNPR